MFDTPDKNVLLIRRDILYSLVFAACCIFLYGLFSLWSEKPGIQQYQEPIREEHASTIGVCDNCPPLKEVINSPWPQLVRDQEAWIGGDTRRQSAAFSKGQWVWCKGQYHAGCASLSSSKNLNHMSTTLVSIYCTNSKWWISSCKHA